MLHCTLGTLGGLAFLVVFLVVFWNIPCAVFGGVSALLASCSGAEFIYRHHASQQNRSTHNHLRLLLLIGL